MSNLLNQYFPLKYPKVLKKLRLAVTKSTSKSKKNKKIHIYKKKFKYFSKYSKLMFIKSELKNLSKIQIKNLKKKSIKSYFFFFNPLIRKLQKKYKLRPKKKYKKKKKRYLFGNSKLRIFGLSKDKYKYALRKIWHKVSLNRRFNFYRLPRLFFFWFIVLYNDLYRYLSKIVWNNWFKFLYSSFIFINQTKLFYSMFSLYNSNYIKNTFTLNNNFFLNLKLNYDTTDILTKKLNFVLGGFNNFFFNGVFLYDLKYISLAYPRHVNLFIKKSYFSKKNIKLKRFFTYKF